MGSRKGKRTMCSMLCTPPTWSNVHPSVKLTSNSSPLLLAQYSRLPLNPSDAMAVTSLLEMGGKALTNSPLLTSYFKSVFPTAVTMYALLMWKMHAVGTWNSFAFLAGVRCISLEEQAMMSE